MKRLLLLSLTTFCLQAFVPPPKPIMASLERLPAELKNLILLHTGTRGGVLNIPALAESLTTLAATSKKLHAELNNPQNMLVILKSLPRAGAIVLAELLQMKEKTLPVMKGKEVEAWLKSFNLSGGQKLTSAVSDEYPNYTLIKDLLSNPNISVNHKDTIGIFGGGGKGYTALMWASGWGHNEIARLLIAAGADVNAKHKDRTVLMQASDEGRLEIVKLLLESGANPTIRDLNGKSALDFARQKERARQICPDRAPLLREFYRKRVHEYNEIIRLLEEVEKAHKESAFLHAENKRLSKI
jgi:hypothetical protein